MAQEIMEREHLASVLALSLFLGQHQTKPEPWEEIVEEKGCTLAGFPAGT